jgi:hypothetical protein
LPDGALHGRQVHAQAGQARHHAQSQFTVDAAGVARAQRQRHAVQAQRPVQTGRAGAGVMAAFAAGQHHHRTALPDGAACIGQQQTLAAGA